MSLDVAIIVIAVSKYTKYGGPFSDVPTLQSAKKVVKWAKNEQTIGPYKVLQITDKFKPVTVSRIKEKVDEFLGENFIDRLIVYFAGHGFSTTEGVQYWALSKFAIDDDECINVKRTIEALGTYGFGKDNVDLDYGQICIISDACRNTGDIAYLAGGQKLCTGSNASEPVDNEYDIFYSTKPKGFSLAKREDVGAGTLPFTLFTECLIDALQGNQSGAIEHEFHEDAPAITNEKLKLHLKKRVLARSIEIDPETPMKPEISTNISARHNVYKKLIHDPILDGEDTPLDGEEDTGAEIGDDLLAINDEFRDMGFEVEAFSTEAKTFIKTHVGKSSYRNLSGNVREAFQSVLDIDQNKSRVENFFKTFRQNHNGYSLQFAFDEIPERVGFHREQMVDLKQTEFGGYLRGSEEYLNEHYFCCYNGHWKVVPKYRNSFSYISHRFDYEPLIYSFDLTGMDNDCGEWEYLFSSYYSRLLDNQMSSSEALKYADKIRIQKEMFPQRSVIAGQKYVVAGDYDNILRTAHYMAESHVGLPFDLALQCARKVYWGRNDQGLKAFADLPAVSAAENETDQRSRKKRPYYAQSSFQERNRVALKGLFPVFSSGWMKLLDRPHWDIPENIRMLSKSITPGYLTGFDDNLAQAFFETFDYRVTDLH